MDNEELIKAAKNIVSENFGASIAQLYETSFKKKDQEQIILILRELLTELVGPQNAEKQLSRILDKL